MSVYFMLKKYDCINNVYVNYVIYFVWQRKLYLYQCDFKCMKFKYLLFGSVFKNMVLMYCVRLK